MKTRTPFAQNRIDYIAYGNPEGVAGLINDYGYEPPADPHELVSATKELVQRKGRKAVKDLIRLHPDRSSILKVEKEQQKEDSYCSACRSYAYSGEDNYCGACGHSNYDGSPESFLEQLTSMSREELEAYYKSALQRSNASPDDPLLAEEVQLVWSELRKRKKETSTEKPTETKAESKLFSGRDGLIILGLVFIAGILVGTSIRPKVLPNG